MLKRVADLTARAYNLGDRVFSAMPHHLHDVPDSKAPIDKAWVAAMAASANAWKRLDELRELLSEKAGGLGPPPPTPDSWGLNEVTDEVAGDDAESKARHAGSLYEVRPAVDLTSR